MAPLHRNAKSPKLLAISGIRDEHRNRKSQKMLRFRSAKPQTQPIHYLRKINSWEFFLGYGMALPNKN